MTDLLNELNVPELSKKKNRVSSWNEASFHRIFIEFMTGKELDPIWGLVTHNYVLNTPQDKHHVGASKLFGRMNSALNCSLCTPFSSVNWGNTRQYHTSLLRAVSKERYFKNYFSTLLLWCDSAAMMSVKAFDLYNSECCIYNSHVSEYFFFKLFG